MENPVNVGLLAVLGNKSLAGKFRSRLPSGVSMRWAVEAEHAKQLISKSKGLQACSPESLQDALLNAGMIGLSLNPLLQHAYLIPRKVYEIVEGRRPLVRTDAELYVSYKGMNATATRTGSVRAIKCKVVYKREPFSLEEGTTVILKHKVIRDTASRGDMVGAYCIATTQAGDRLVEYMTIDDIHKARARSESWKNERSRPYSPWTTDPEEMWKKTVQRRASKYWPQTVELAAMTATMDKLEHISPIEATDIVRVITDEQVNELHGIVSDNLPDADVATWTSRLARSYGVEHLSELPESDFKDAKALLVKSVKEKGNG